MTHASLFTGIGGFDLAAEWMGWNNVFQVEIDPFCQKILKYHFPNAQRFTDIREFDGRLFRGSVDVLSGGFPCQPYSTAGKRKGKDDERHLWPEMLRVIREISPRWVVGENVRGLVSWNGGVVFEEVCADLETEEYEVIPFLLPASGVNAPHRRDRVWFIAHAVGNGHKRENGITDDRFEAFESPTIEEKRKRVRNDFRGDDAKGATANTQGQQKREPANDSYTQSDVRQTRLEPCGTCGEGFTANAKMSNGKRNRICEVCRERETGRCCIETDVTDTHGNKRSEGRMYEAESKEAERYAIPYDAWDSGNWENFPTQSPLCGGNDGLPTRLDRAAVFEGVKESKRKSTEKRWIEESLKGYGNAVVPQVVYQIFKAIEQYDQVIDKI